MKQKVKCGFCRWVGDSPVKRKLKTAGVDYPILCPHCQAIGIEPFDPPPLPERTEHYLRPGQEQSPAYIAAAAKRKAIQADIDKTNQLLDFLYSEHRAALNLEHHEYKVPWTPLSASIAKHMGTLPPWADQYPLPEDPNLITFDTAHNPPTETQTDDRAPSPPVGEGRGEGERELQPELAL